MSDTEAVIDLIGNDKLSPAFKSAASSGDALTDAMMGLADAVEQVSAATKDETKASSDAAKTSDAAISTTAREVKAVEGLNAAVKDSIAATNTGTAARRESTKVTKEATTKGTRYWKEMERVAEAARKAAESEAGFLGQLKPVIGASREYAESVSKATAGTDGWIKGLGHVSVALDTISRGGIPAVIAGLDLWTMGFSAVKRAGEVVVGIARDFAVAASGQRDLAVSIGSNIDQYSQFAAAVQLSGKDLGNAREMLGAMQGRMLEALTTTGKLTGAWQKLDVSLFDANGRMKTSTELVYNIADAFQGMDDGPQKTAMAIQLLGEQGTKWIPILNEGSAKLRAQGLEAEALGATYTKADAEIGDALKKAQARVGVFVDGANNAIGRMVTPAVTAGIEMLGSVAEKVFLSVASNASAADYQIAKLAQNQKAAEQIQKVAEADSLLRSSLRETAVDVQSNIQLTQSYSREMEALTKAKQDNAEARKLAGSDQSTVQALQEEAGQIERSIALLKQREVAINGQVQATNVDRAAKYDQIAAHVELLEAMKKSIETSYTQTAADQIRLKQLEELIEKDKAALALELEGDKALRDHVDAMKQANAAASVGLEKKNLEAKALAEIQALNTALFNERAHQIALTKTAEQELALAVMKAQDGVVQAERTFAADRATRADQLKAKQIEARQAVFDAATDLMAQEATIEQQVSQRKIAAQADVLKAHVDRLARQETRELRFQKLVMDEEDKTDQMREQYASRDLTRAERVKQAKLAHLNEIANKEESTADLQARIANATLVALEAKRDLEHEVAAATYETLVTSAKAAEFQKNGAAMIQAQAGAAQMTADALGLNVNIAAALGGQLSYCNNSVESCASGANQMAAGFGNAKNAVAQIGATLDTVAGKISLVSGSIQKIQMSGQQMGGTVTIGGRTIQMPQQGLPGAAGMSAVAAYQADVANAQAFAEADRRNQERQAMLDRNEAARQAAMTPAQRAAAEKAAQIKAKKDQLASIGQNAEYNRQMAELDLMIQNATTAQSNSFAPTLAPLRNQADVLSQQSSILDTRRQIGNFGALSSGQNVLDLLGQRSAVLNAQRALNNFDAMASGQNVLDLLSQRTAIADARRTLGNFDAMASGQNTLDLLSQQRSISDTRRTLGNFGQMAAGQNVLDVLSQQSNIANVQRTIDNFASMASGMNALDLLNQRTSNLEIQRQISNHGAMAPGAAAGEALKTTLSDLSSSDKRFVDWGTIPRTSSGSAARVTVKSQGVEVQPIRKTWSDQQYASIKGQISDLKAVQGDSPTVRGMAAYYGITGYASGTGIGGVPGVGRGDKHPALLEAGEIVLSRTESDEVRRRAAGGSIAQDVAAAVAEAIPSQEPIDYARLAAIIAAAVASAMKGVRIEIDGRRAGQATYKRSRNGQAIMYGPAGSTTVF